MQISEYMHPRLQEICDVLAAPLGRYLLASEAAPACRVGHRKGRVVRTSTVSGFLMLYLLAAMRRWRRTTLRFQVEDARIGGWLEQICAAAPADYALAVEICECQRLVKGYGDTHERGAGNFHTVMTSVRHFGRRADAAQLVRRLREAALADERGERLAAAIRELGLPRSPVRT